MLLAKSCHTEHNIKNGTLKLGTLHEYRATEIQQIADRHEGTLEFNLKIDGKIELQTQWFNTIFGGSIQLGNEPPLSFPGTFTSYINELNFEHGINNSVPVSNSSATIFAEYSNSFVFCMSSIKEKQDCAHMFPDYEDYWFSEPSQARDFGMAIKDILLETIKSNHQSKNFVLPENTPMEGLSINLCYGHVKYIPRELHITEKNAINLNELMQRITNTTFIKPPSFRKEQEYRFHYTIVSNNQVVEPTVTSLILDATKLQPFIL